MALAPSSRVVGSVPLYAMIHCVISPTFFQRTSTAIHDALPFVHRAFPLREPDREHFTSHFC